MTDATSVVPVRRALRTDPVVALRLTPKPAQLAARIAAAVDELRTVTCPRTLAVSEEPPGGSATPTKVVAAGAISSL